MKTKIVTHLSKFTLQKANPNRLLKSGLFKRIYDQVVPYQFIAESNGLQLDDLVVAEMKEQAVKYEKIICVGHDIEKGLGHLGIDAERAAFADQYSPRYLVKMLRVEKQVAVTATYNVVGCLLNEVYERIERDGHCVAFHSFDHDLNALQLERCNNSDYSLKGYRPPCSRITEEITDENLIYYNFDWLANASCELGFDSPVLENGLVKIPIMFDDYDLYKYNMPYDQWEEEALSKISEHQFTAFCLHDCYADYWLPNYKNFLLKISELGTLKNFNQVAEEVILEYPKGC